MEIKRYTKDKIDDVLQFEFELREEDDWGWEINDAYLQSVKESFEKKEYQSSISLLAYVDEKVVGRIDSSMIYSHFDGSKKAYLDWICVLKKNRHQGIAQALMKELRIILKQEGVDTLIGLIDCNDEAQRFYRHLENTKIKDEGIWIDC